MSPLHLLRTVSGFEVFPDAKLQNWLERGKILLLHTKREEILQVFGDVHQGRIRTC